jgi:hypothetical protein
LTKAPEKTGVERDPAKAPPFVVLKMAVGKGLGLAVKPMLPVNITA